MEGMPLQDDETLSKVFSEICKSLKRAGHLTMHLASLSLNMDMEFETQQLLESLSSLRDIAASTGNAVSSMLAKIEKQLNKREVERKNLGEREKGVSESEV